MEDSSSRWTSARYSLKEVLGAISILFTMMAACAGGGWAVRGKVEESRLADYDAAKKLKLSDAVTELRSFAETIKPNIEERRSMEKLEALQPRVARLEAQLKEATDQRDSLKATVERLTGTGIQTVEIAERGSERIIPNGAVLGVVHALGTRCELSYANTQKSFVIGEGDGRRDPASGVNYEFVVRNIRENSCVIDYEINPPARKPAPDQ